MKSGDVDSMRVSIRRRRIHVRKSMNANKRHLLYLTLDLHYHFSFICSSFTMAPIDAGSLILVTGGNGFIAAHCIANLLQSDYHVRATVRSTEKAEAARNALSTAGVQHLARLQLVVVPDPTNLDALVGVLENCQAILHLASAFSYDAAPGEFEERLMFPALKGTQVICEAAQRCPTVRRVVIMSSFASVYDASLGLQPGRVYTEKDWCPLTYEDGVDASAVVSLCSLPCLKRPLMIVAHRIPCLESRR